MNFLENRCPLFRIMLQGRRLFANECARRIGDPDQRDLSAHVSGRGLADEGPLTLFHESKAHEARRSGVSRFAW
jgi:hypothetical protein